MINRSLLLLPDTSDTVPLLVGASVGVGVVGSIVSSIISENLVKKAAL